MKPTCPKCDHIHPAATSIAVARFREGGPIGYRLDEPWSPRFLTRADAEAEWCRLARYRSTQTPAA